MPLAPVEWFAADNKTFAAVWQAILVMMFNVKGKGQNVFDRLAAMEKTLIGRRKGVDPIPDYEGLRDLWW